jgi:hypothetical protein
MTIHNKDRFSSSNFDSMTAEERLDEVAEILASGILRLRAKRIENSGETESIILDKRNQMDPYETNTNTTAERRVS